MPGITWPYWSYVLVGIASVGLFFLFRGMGAEKRRLLAEGEEREDLTRRLRRDFTIGAILCVLCFLAVMAYVMVVPFMI
jgi:hypothetical protein